MSIIHEVADHELEEAYSFSTWLEDELRHGNQGIDIAHGTMDAEEAKKLLKKIHERFTAG